eukprot:8741003-Pyramimonas_sp.AAC.1
MGRATGKPIHEKGKTKRSKSKRCRTAAAKTLVGFWPEGLRQRHEKQLSMVVPVPGPRRHL